jgi:hypothetical protein
MAVTTFHDFPLVSRNREWDGTAAEKRVRVWADAEDKPNGKHHDAHIWYDAGSKRNFTAYKLLFTDVVNGRRVAVPRAIMVAGNQVAELRDPSAHAEIMALRAAGRALGQHATWLLR